MSVSGLESRTLGDRNGCSIFPAIGKHVDAIRQTGQKMNLERRFIILGLAALKASALLTIGPDFQ